MKMTKEDVARYPRLAYYVKHDLAKLVKVPAVVRALERVGQIQRPTLERALKWGAGPEVKVTELKGAFGEFTPDSKSNEIRIDTKVVTEFEAGRGKRVARAGKVYLVGVTLIHELVHWGDDQDGVDRPGEEGEELENSLYGSVIY